MGANTERTSREDRMRHRNKDSTRFVPLIITTPALAACLVYVLLVMTLA
jgi:hypothetical protein